MLMGYLDVGILGSCPLLLHIPIRLPLISNTDALGNGIPVAESTITAVYVFAAMEDVIIDKYSNIVYRIFVSGLVEV